ncbi:hypothetical protein AVEN_162904-1, partial [Araneus ventricosus]
MPSPLMGADSKPAISKSTKQRSGNFPIPAENPEFVTVGKEYLDYGRKKFGSIFINKPAR